MIDDDSLGGAAPTRARTRATAALIFFQMLPATLLSPAIRPLFVQHHAGNESLMHAFMAVNMGAAVLLVPWLAARAERLSDTRGLLTWLTAADSVLLLAFSLPVSAPWLLSLRALQGVTHVGATSMLLAEMARSSQPSERGRAMGMAGAALMLAVALGSAIGGIFVAIDTRLPFVVGGLVQAGVTFCLLRTRAAGSHALQRRVALPSADALPATLRPLLVPLFAVFVGRFTVGCLVVTFALFAHRVHGISDRAIGLLFSLVTLPFAAAMYPCARLAERMPRALLLVFGATTHAAALLALGHVDRALLPLVMIVMGIASACLFSPTLCYAGERTDAARQRRMAVLNAAGCLGMVLGPVAAGITSAVVGQGDPIAGYRAVFALAASSVASWLVLSLPWLIDKTRHEREALRARPVARTSRAPG